MENPTERQLVNPEGVVEIASFNMNPHLEPLDGKTVLLRWNGKHNGDVLLNRIAELLAENAKGINFVRSWEVAPETATMSGSPDNSRKNMQKLAKLKPDISIGSQAD
ncbi:hypothetical protein ACFLTV_03005 [Chloroflexota bacterium]